MNKGTGTLAADVLDKLYTELAKFPGVATTNDNYLALSYAVRDRLLHRWVDSARSILQRKQRTVIYLSAEYLIGPQLGSNIMTLGIEAEAAAAAKELGTTLETLVDHEEEPGLGNGGLGRLAACYMDSLATLDIAAVGHGLRYEFGIFDQDIRDGWQVERTDRWLRNGNPWEIRRYEIEHTVGFGGYTEHGAAGARWLPARIVKGVRRRMRRSPVTARRPRTSCGCGAPRPPRSSISTRSRSANTGVRSMRRSAART